MCDRRILVIDSSSFVCISGPQWTNRQVTRCWAECREEFRYNLDILDCLVRAHLINLQQFDMQLASVLEQALNAGIGSSILALGFAMQLVHVYLLEGPASGAPVVITENDLANTIEILTRIAAHARYCVKKVLSFFFSVFLFIYFYFSNFYYFFNFSLLISVVDNRQMVLQLFWNYYEPATRRGSWIVRLVVQVVQQL